MSATPDPAHPTGAGNAADASGSIAPVALPEPAETAAPADGRVERRPDPPAACLPFGPYAGQTVAAVAVMDPDYLLALVREGIGPAELRAEAARALALRERLPRPSGWGGPGAEADRPVQPGGAIARGSGSGAWPAHPGSTRAAGSSPSAWGLGAAIGLLLLLAGVGHGDRLGRSSSDAAAETAGTDGARPAAAARDPLAWSGSTPAKARPAAAGGRAAARPAGADDASRGAAPAPQVEAGESSNIDPAAPCGARLAGAIPAESAADFLDTFQAVEFEVVGTKDTGRVTFLNSHDPYAGHFYVAIFPDDYASFPEPPARYFRNRCVVIQGSIEAYRGTAQIVLRDPEDIRLVEPDAAAAGP